MEEPTEELNDAGITVNIDTSDDTRIPEEMLEIGLGVTELHEETNLNVTSVGVNVEDGYPANFRIEGSVYID